MHLQYNNSLCQLSFLSCFISKNLKVFYYFFFLYIHRYANFGSSSTIHTRRQHTSSRYITVSSPTLIILKLTYYRQ